MKKQKWFKRIALRFRKKRAPHPKTTDKKRYLVIVVDQKTGEVIENEQTNGVFGVILKKCGPEYLVSINAGLTDITSMIMRTEDLVKSVKDGNPQIRECEQDILRRGKENAEKGMR